MTTRDPMPWFIAGVAILMVAYATFSGQSYIHGDDGKMYVRMRTWWLMEKDYELRFMKLPGWETPGWCYRINNQWRWVDFGREPEP